MCVAGGLWRRKIQCAMGSSTDTLQVSHPCLDQVHMLAHPCFGGLSRYVILLHTSWQSKVHIANRFQWHFSGWATGLAST